MKYIGRRRGRSGSLTDAYISRLACEGAVERKTPRCRLAVFSMMAPVTRTICSIFRQSRPTPALTPEELEAHRRIHQWAHEAGIHVSINRVKPKD